MDSMTKLHIYTFNYFIAYLFPFESGVWLSEHLSNEETKPVSLQM